MSNPNPEMPYESVELPSEDTKRQFVELAVAIALKGKYEDYSVELNDGRELVCSTGEALHGNELVAGATICDEGTIDPHGTKWSIHTYYDITSEGRVLKRLIREWISDGNTPPDLGLSTEEQAALDADLKAQADEAVIEAANYHLMTGEEKFRRLLDKWSAETEAEEQMNAAMPVTEQELKEVIQLLKEAFEKVKNLPFHEDKGMDIREITAPEQVSATDETIRNIPPLCYILLWVKLMEGGHKESAIETFHLPDDITLTLTCPDFHNELRYDISIIDPVNDQLTSYVFKFAPSHEQHYAKTISSVTDKEAWPQDSLITEADAQRLVEFLQEANRQQSEEEHDG